MSVRMGKVSIIVPSRSGQFLTNTVDDLFAKASGEIEVIAVLDGPPSLPPPRLRPNLIIIAKPQPEGMRKAINAGAKAATGKYLMKTDSHCLFDEGFDLKLKTDCQENWVVIPRRYSLDGQNWTRDLSRPIRDYHYLCFPLKGKKHDWGMHGVEWPERSREKSGPKYDVDDNMSFQGSLWFMHKKWFTDFLGGMDENEIYAGWAQEPTEIGNKTWLGGGAVKVNKKTWYAHLHKGKNYRRNYRMDESGVIRGHHYSAYFWMNNLWPKRVHNIDWLVEKFWPIPTWPENWKKVWDKQMAEGWPDTKAGGT